MASVKWLPEAIRDIERLHDFLNIKDAQASARAAQCIFKGAILLKSNPGLGRPMPDSTGRRELFIAFGAGAYVLRYILESNEVVVIIRVWHNRENRQ